MMTTIDYTAITQDAPARRRGQPGRVLRRWHAWLRQRRAERRTRIALSQLDSRTLRDIGINPRDLRDDWNASLLFQPMNRSDF